MYLGGLVSIDRLGVLAEIGEGRLEAVQVEATWGRTVGKTKTKASPATVGVPRRR